MAGKAHEIFIIVSATCGDVDDVMNFGGGSEKANLKAPLAERMLGDIEVSNLPPAASEAFISIRIAFEPVPVILSVVRAGVL